MQSQIELLPESVSEREEEPCKRQTAIENTRLNQRADRLRKYEWRRGAQQRSLKDETIHAAKHKQHLLSNPNLKRRTSKRIMRLQHAAQRDLAHSSESPFCLIFRHFHDFYTKRRTIFVIRTHDNFSLITKETFPLTPFQIWLWRWLSNTLKSYQSAEEYYRLSQKPFVCGLSSDESAKHHLISVDFRSDIKRPIQFIL